MPRPVLKRSAAASFVVALLCLTGHSAMADFHFWYIKEIFTNHNGSVQFIELFTDAAGQQFLDDHSITSTTSPPFPFLVNSPAPTNGHHLLLATAGFGSIPGGAVPNYTIPSNFFSTSADTINFGPGASIRTFASIPTDGEMSLNYTSAGVLTTARNSPRNYANQGDTLTPGDYNGNRVVDAADYALWRDTVSQTPPAGTGADGSANGTIDTADFDFWKARFGNAAPGSAAGAVSTAVPEPATVVLLILGSFLWCVSIKGGGRTSQNHVRRLR